MSSLTATTVGHDSTYDEEAGGATVRQSRPWWHIWQRHAGPSPEARVARDAITKPLESCPPGYPMLAIFQSSDRNFLQFRGFLDLHARLLLDCQAEIEYLEKKLEEIDKFDMDCGIETRLKSLKCRERDQRGSDLDTMPEEFRLAGLTRTRPEMLKDLKVKLMEYDDLLLKTQSINALQRPFNRDHRSLVNWCEARRPLVNDEMAWIYRKEDLVTLRIGREYGRFDNLVEKIICSLDRILSRYKCTVINKVFVSAELRDKTTDKWLYYYTPGRLEVMVNLLIVAIVFVLVVLPVIVLYELSSGSSSTSPFEAIGVLIIFTLVFGSTMSALTTATRQELFAASATYCALLVVFITNFTTQTVTIQK